jgi:hypothetical protein
MGWPKLFTLSQNVTPGNGFLSPDGTLKMRIRFVQFGGNLECSSGLKEHFKVLEVKAGAKVLENVGTLWKSKALSDLKIETLDGKVLEAHRFMLAGTKWFICNSRFVYFMEEQLYLIGSKEHSLPEDV